MGTRTVNGSSSTLTQTDSVEYASGVEALADLIIREITCIGVALEYPDEDIRTLGIKPEGHGICGQNERFSIAPYDTPTKLFYYDQTRCFQNIPGCSAPKFRLVSKHGDGRCGRLMRGCGRCLPTSLLLILLLLGFKTWSLLS